MSCPPGFISFLQTHVKNYSHEILLCSTSPCSFLKIERIWGLFQVKTRAETLLRLAAQAGKGAVAEAGLAGTQRGGAQGTPPAPFPALSPQPMLETGDREKGGKDRCALGSKKKPQKSVAWVVGLFIKIKYCFLEQRELLFFLMYTEQAST